MPAEAKIMRQACDLQHDGVTAWPAQAVDAWLAMVRGLAAQWFGVWVRPKAPADAWLLEGLAAYLEHLFISRFLGRNEAAYRCAAPACSL